MAPLNTSYALYIEYFSYFIQLNAVKGPDASGPAYYNMSMANITLSPQETKISFRIAQNKTYVMVEQNNILNSFSMEKFI